ncbi:nucleoside deaminase [Methanolobus sp. ZRKC3]|uniref:nucleoside deaminase n=1 Tax=Methanolobus sp. ZRKC3 TaxID=3125786 RepID=UPI00324F1B3A
MNQFMQIAIGEAREGMNSNHGGPFGAVIVKDGNIISRSHNKVLHTNDPTAHAEVEAIREASAFLERFDLSDCEIYTTSQPCPMCLAAIYWARIKKIYFGTDKDEVSSVGFDDSRFYEIIRGHIADPELSFVLVEKEGCLKLLDEWDKKPDKQMY